MKTLQMAFLAFITSVLIISCKKDSESSKENYPTPSSYSFKAIQASFGQWIVFDQFTRQGNMITAKKKNYFKRQQNATENDSVEFVLQFDIARAINKVGNYSVKGNEVKVFFSYTTSAPNPGTTFTHKTIKGTIKVDKVDQTTKTIIGTFDWEGEIVGANPIPPDTIVTQKLIGGTFILEMIY